MGYFVFAEVETVAVKILVLKAVSAKATQYDAARRNSVSGIQSSVNYYEDEENGRLKRRKLSPVWVPMKRRV